MLTVQETLKNLNKERLISSWLYFHPIEYWRPELSGLKVDEILTAYKNKLSSFIDRMASIEITSSDDGKSGLIYGHRVMKNGFDEPQCELIILEDLLEKGCAAQEYDFIFTKQSEIAGFFVADTPYTQDNIYDLMTQVLFESSFFGFQQEHLAEELQNLENVKNEIENENADAISAEESFDKLCKKFGLEPERDPETEEEREKRYQADYVAFEYSKMTANREKSSILNLLTPDPQK